MISHAMATLAPAGKWSLLAMHISLGSSVDEKEMNLYQSNMLSMDVVLISIGILIILHYERILPHKVGSVSGIQWPTHQFF